MLMGWSTVPEGKGKACQALSVWEEASTNKGTALRFLPSNEEMVTVTWQTLCKDKFCLIPQGHLSHLWTVMSATCYNFPCSDCTSTINDTSWGTEMITIQQISLSSLPTGHRTQPPAARAPKPLVLPPSTQTGPSCAEHYSLGQTALHCSPTRSLGKILTISLAQNP